MVRCSTDLFRGILVRWSSRLALAIGLGLCPGVAAAFDGGTAAATFVPAAALAVLAALWTVFARRQAASAKLKEIAKKDGENL